MTDEQDMLAASWVLGLLEDRERAEAAAMIECVPSFRAAVAEWERRLTPLYEKVAPVQPSSDLWDRITTAIDAQPASPVVAPASSAEAVWEALVAGVQIREVWRDSQTGERSAIFRMEPGSMIESHYHDVDEECVVLEGRVILDGQEYSAGMSSLSLAGTTHQSIVTASGTTMLVRWGAQKVA